MSMYLLNPAFGKLSQPWIIQVPLVGLSIQETETAILFGRYKRCSFIWFRQRPKYALTSHQSMHQCLSDNFISVVLRWMWS
jgi:hypothetical protein